ncbi:MAG TPA: hypothetical protein VFJ57_15575 [Solirubrobacterales bacterium]|nr:hypothetical protein [Solirubrobacterales bacterium]
MARAGRGRNRSAGPFYESLFPPGFLSLGWSSIAVHWLSRVARPIPDHIYCSFAQGEVREALREQSATDWRAFLTHRARELRPGGRLVVVGGAALDDGSSGAEGLMEMANSALQELITAGELTEAEYVAMTIPTWNRTTPEFLAPLESGEAGGLQRRLRMARLGARHGPVGCLSRPPTAQSLFIESVQNLVESRINLEGLATSHLPKVDHTGLPIFWLRSIEGQHQRGSRHQFTQDFPIRIEQPEIVRAVAFAGYLELRVAYARIEIHGGLLLS